MIEEQTRRPTATEVIPVFIFLGATFLAAFAYTALKLAPQILIGDLSFVEMLIFPTAIILIGFMGDIKIRYTKISSAPILHSVGLIVSYIVMVFVLTQIFLTFF